MEPRVLKPAKVSNLQYYWLGLLFLFLNKIRHSFSGYTTPRTFSVSDFNRAVAYDFTVTKNWEKILQHYTHDQFTWTNKKVLELGPGEDLGIGLILLSKGAAKYNALDTNNLIKNTPPEFYDKLISVLPQDFKNFLNRQISLTQNGHNEKLNYICRPDFDLTVFKDENINLVVSQAAFEHFNNVDQTLTELSQIVESGTILMTEIDLKTHTRWLRDHDPLNIYRYSDWLYKLLEFKGSPNRLRPNQYAQILKANGWTNIQILPEVILDKTYTDQVRPSLNQSFTEDSKQMDYLSVIICATKI